MRLLQSDLVFELIDLVFELYIIIIYLLGSLLDGGRPGLVLVKLVFELLNDSVVVPNASLGVSLLHDG